jgi:hypothetical protein
MLTNFFVYLIVDNIDNSRFLLSILASISIRRGYCIEAKGRKVVQLLYHVHTGGFLYFAIGMQTVRR